MTAQLVSRPTFEQVFADNLDYVWRLLRHFGVADKDVDDVAQEVFVVVHRRLPSWEPQAQIRSWLFTIVRRTARDHREQAWNRRSVPLPPTWEPVAADSPHDTVHARAALARVERVLSQLDEEQRMTFVLYEIEGVTMGEIAAAMNCPLKTAYSRLRLARSRVRAVLAQTERDHG